MNGETKLTPNLTAELVAYSSVVGRSVMFKNDAGACVALVMISVPNPQFDYQETADPIANLIAAAPEMLAALKSAQAALSDGGFQGLHVDAALRAIDTAIAKAESRP